MFYLLLYGGGVGRVNGKLSGGVVDVLMRRRQGKRAEVLFQKRGMAGIYICLFIY